MLSIFQKLNIARKAVNKIMENISNRQGIGDELGVMNDNIKQEMKQEWRKLIVESITEVELGSKSTL